MGIKGWFVVIRVFLQNLIILVDKLMTFFELLLFEGSKHYTVARLPRILCLICPLLPCIYLFCHVFSCIKFYGSAKASYEYYFPYQLIKVGPVFPVFYLPFVLQGSEWT